MRLEARRACTGFALFHFLQYTSLSQSYPKSLPLKLAKHRLVHIDLACFDCETEYTGLTVALEDVVVEDLLAMFRIGTPLKMSFLFRGCRVQAAGANTPVSGDET